MPTMNVYIDKETKQLIEQVKEIDPAINWSEVFQSAVKETAARRRMQKLALLKLRADMKNPLVFVPAEKKAFIPPRRVGTGFETSGEHFDAETA